MVAKEPIFELLASSELAIYIDGDTPQRSQSSLLELCRLDCLGVSVRDVTLIYQTV